MNQSLFLWLNHAAALAPDWLWASLTVTGHASVVVALFAPFLFFRRQLLTALFVAAVLGGLVSTGLKNLFQVARPPAVLTADQFHLIGHKLELVSFPSGHSITAFTVAILLILGLQLRGKWLLAPLLLACFVGLSRIAVGAHWPLDVLGGAVIGLLCGYVSQRLAVQFHQRYPFASGSFYIRVQNLLVLVVSVSLFFTDMGYPEAWLWQGFSAVYGVFFSVFALILA